jgi:hypothetical protein
MASKFLYSADSYPSLFVERFPTRVPRFGNLRMTAFGGELNRSTQHPQLLEAGG